MTRQGHNSAIGGRALAMVAAIALSSSLTQIATAPPSASASLTASSTGLVSALTGAPGTTAPDLNAVFNSPNAGSLLQAAGCPIAQALPSPPTPSQISSVICALNVLNYAYRTVYVQSNGVKLTRITRGVVGIPTPIDVNGDGVPDFTGTLSPTLTGAALTLSISRLPTFSRTADVSIEAVALDPAASRTYVGAGEDGLIAGTDSNWSATVTLLSDTTVGAEIGLTQNNSGAPASGGTIGEIFSGSNPDSPANTARGDVRFTPVPSTITADVNLANADQHVSVTTSASARLDGAVSLISRDEDKEITATADQLARSVGVDYAQPSSGETKVTYTADAVVGRFSAQYHDTQKGALTTAAALDATTLPTGVTVDQVGAQTSVTTSGGPVGSVEARYGSGREVPAIVGGSGAYAAYHGYSDGTLTAGVRLPNLVGLTLNAARPFSGELTLGQSLDYVTLSAQDDGQGYVIAGHLKNLPQHSSVGIDFKTTYRAALQAHNTVGTVTFKGDNAGVETGVGEIAADITNTTGPFVGRANEINATIDGIPGNDTIKFNYGDGEDLTLHDTQAAASATQPIGTIQVLASDGSSAADTAPSTHGGSGVWYVDTKDVYYALARMDQLTGYTVSLSKDSSDAIQSMSGAITTGGQDVTDCQDTGASNQDVTVHAETNGGTFDSTLDQLPTSASFSLAPDPAGDEIVDYQASAPIRKITADATGFSSFESLGQGGDIVGPLDRFHGEIDCLPAHMTLVLYKSGETSLNTYGKHIGKVVAQVYNQQVGPATPADVSPPDASDATNPAPSGDQLAYYDTASKGISIDLNNVGGFDYVDDGTSGILKLKYDLDSTTPIAYHYAASGPPALELDGSVDHPQPGTLTVNTATEGTIDMHFAATANSSNLTGDGGLGTVGFDGSIIPQTGSAAYLQGVLANVPANLDVCVDYSTGVEDCSPSWVYQDSLDLNTDNPPQNFAVQVIPTDLNGEIPTTPLTFSGAFCFGTTSQSACYATGAGEGGGPAGVFVGGSNPLTFNALILGFGQHTDDCGDFNYTCGRVWAGIDTTDEGTYPDGQLSGQARYYGKGQKEPEIRFNTATGGYVQTDQLYAWADYSAGSSTGFDEVTDGKIKCGSPETLYLNELGGINLLRNSVVGLCP